MNQFSNQKEVRAAVERLSACEELGLTAAKMMLDEVLKMSFFKIARAGEFSAQATAAESLALAVAMTAVRAASRGYRQGASCYDVFLHTISDLAVREHHAVRNVGAFLGGVKEELERKINLNAHGWNETDDVVVGKFVERSLGGGAWAGKSSYDFVPTGIKAAGDIVAGDCLGFRPKESPEVPVS